MIQVRNLTKYYAGFKAVDDLSFSVDRGLILGFLGPNGAGKTTTMRIMAGYLPASAGSAQIAGFNVFSQSREVRRRIGYMPESVPLYSDMRVTEYLVFRAKVKGMRWSERRRHVADAMDRCQIAHRQRDLIGQLSKGYRQRVGLADALLAKPDVLILDEPTIGLDPNQVREVRNLIRGLKGNHTVVLSTHILSEVEAVCDRVVIIHEGRIATQDSLENLRDRGTLIASVKGPKGEAMDALGSVGGVRKVECVSANGEEQHFRIHLEAGADPREAIFDRVQERKWKLVELRREPIPLEEIFASITSGRTSDERTGSV